MTQRIGFICILIGAIAAAGNGFCASKVTLSHGVIVPASQTEGPAAKAAVMLQEEILKRTGVRLELLASAPEDGVPAILFGLADSTPGNIPAPPAGLTVPAESEGYALWVDAGSRKAPKVYIVGRDTRGLLFGAGRLLRALDMRQGKMSLDKGFHAACAPRYPVRGHELGYRNKSNTYDAWDMAQYEQYIRDLAVFGANEVQLVVQLDNAAQSGPHMTEPVLERTIKLSQLLKDYGLGVWIWLALSEDAITTETAPAVLEHCQQFFEQCAQIDTIFVPGGDPGDTPPEVLVPFLKDMSVLLKKFHPNAQVWLSNEDMPHEWNATLFKTLSEEQPDWIDGVVFGTWVKTSLQDMRAKIPAKYPFVQYADITHSLECQYPVDQWDQAFATTLGRETANPRPVAFSHIYSLMGPLTIGFSSYSDGVNDDVHKILWSGLGWDPDAAPRDILEEYGEYFVGDDLGDEVAEGLMALEQNWVGPLLSNREVKKTLKRWQRIEKKAGDRCDTNWRLEMGLLRAYYDAYVQEKLIAETKRQERACKVLAKAGKTGAVAAIEEAKNILGEADARPDAPELRARVEQLGEGLFKNIGMQLSVDKYGAANWERGAVLDALDQPLTDRLWLEAQFDKILALSDEKGRLALLDSTINWENPGPGGFYDDLGNPEKQPHLVHQKTWAEDPGYVESPQGEFIEISGREAWRRSWRDQGQTLFGTPLCMHYDGLDPNAEYVLRVVYTGRFRSTMRLVANGSIEIHAPLAQPAEVEPLEFSIPKEATAGGSLDLEWQLLKGRGCQVAETWLMPVH